MKPKVVFSMLSQLAGVTRYSQTSLADPESTLEHLGFVTLLCYIIGLELNSLNDEEPYINMEELLRKAIIHDVPELITGDIPRPTKYFSDEGAAVFKKIELGGMRQLMDNLGYKDVIAKPDTPEPDWATTEAHRLEKIRYQILADWTHAKSDREGAIVAFVDFLAVAFAIQQEVILKSNLGFITHIRDIDIYISQVAQMIDKVFVNQDVRMIILSIFTEAKSIINFGMSRDSGFLVHAYRDQHL